MGNDTRGKTQSAIQIIDRLVGDDVELREMIAEETTNVQVARLIRETRLAAGLTQRQLAQRIGTTQSTIARLEDADYEGHSLSMLQRMAQALDLRVDVRFVQPRRRVRRASTPAAR